MTLLGDALFNLMLNAIASFWFGLAVAELIGRIARPRPAVALLVLLLPVAKLLWDLRSGIPASSFFWASEQGIKQRLGSFQIGVGVHPWGPIIEGHLLALHAAGSSPQSFADVLSRALRFRVSVYAAAVASFALLAVSVIKLGARSLRLAAFRRNTRARLLEDGACECRAVGRRTARIYVSKAYSGVPFAGGLLRPYLVFPARVAECLSHAERNAVIEHELGHIRHFDLALLLPLELLCELLWFVPGFTWLLRRLRSLLEQRADACAVAAGVAREAVASALLLVAELSEAESSLPVLAMSRGPSTLRVRVERLLMPEPTLVVKPWLSLLRGLLLIWVVLGLLQANACGNHF